MDNPDGTVRYDFDTWKKKFKNSLESWHTVPHNNTALSGTGPDFLNQSGGNVYLEELPVSEADKALKVPEPMFLRNVGMEDVWDVHPLVEYGGLGNALHLQGRLGKTLNKIMPANTKFDRMLGGTPFKLRQRIALVEDPMSFSAYVRGIYPWP